MNKKYKVQFKQTETFIVDVIAKSEEEARAIAYHRFDRGNYEEVGDCEVKLDVVFDVTNTDDPFSLQDDFEKRLEASKERDLF